MPIQGAWSSYVAEMHMQYVFGLSLSPQPTGFTARLYSDNANPDGGGSNTEVVDSGYSGQATTMDASGLTAVNDADIVFGPFVGTVTVAGVALTDNLTGFICFWVNLVASQELAGGGGVEIPAGQFVVNKLRFIDL